MGLWMREILVEPEKRECNLESVDDTYSSDEGHGSDLFEKAETSFNGLGQDGPSAGTLF